MPARCDACSFPVSPLRCALSARVGAARAASRYANPTFPAELLDVTKLKPLLGAEADLKGSFLAPVEQVPSPRIFPASPSSHDLR